MAQKKRLSLLHFIQLSPLAERYCFISPWTEAITHWEQSTCRQGPPGKRGVSGLSTIRKSGFRSFDSSSSSGNSNWISSDVVLKTVE
ncbi:hypothetical protein P5673_007289 [Acropora cervicornis]|uniref:Uncharacterized protein n=1 Tax=Acropora cervicornis TaxID=6130 RepID=A0AAD9QVG4_ACRCE|nr:hypothetical protein P5673_007289 [Acropora cervicornis]